VGEAQQTRSSRARGLNAGAGEQGPESSGPGFVSRERARFIHDEGPLLVIAGNAATEALPALRLEHGRPARCDGWRLVAQLTVCVVDGPGDAGFLVQASAIQPRLENRAIGCDRSRLRVGRWSWSRRDSARYATLEEAAACSESVAGSSRSRLVSHPSGEGLFERLALASSMALSSHLWISRAKRASRAPSRLTPGAQYCTGIGQRKVHHLPRR